MYEFPIIVKPLLHVNTAAFPFKMINTLPFLGSLSAGHSIPVRKIDNVIDTE